MNNLTSLFGQNTNNYQTLVIDQLSLSELKNVVLYADVYGIIRGIEDLTGYLHSDGNGVFTFSGIDSNSVTYHFTNGNRLLQSSNDGSEIEESNILYLSNYFGIPSYEFLGNVIITDFYFLYVKNITSYSANQINFIINSTSPMQITDTLINCTAKLKCNTLEYMIIMI